MSKKKRLFVGIAVQSPNGFRKLPGVHKALDKMAEFARISDTYDAPILISDKEEPVTAERINKQLTPDLLLDRPRVTIYFCGHGAFVSGIEIWYLSDGQSLWENRIDVMAFRGVLATYGFEQISIFSDACQSAVHHETKASPILREHPGTSPPPDYDLFRATIRGEAAYATEEYGPLFSKAMTDALSPSSPNVSFDLPIYDAYDKYVVTSQSLIKYVRANLPDFAAEAGRHQHPEMTSNFVYPDNDYLEVGSDKSKAKTETFSVGDEATAGKNLLRTAYSASRTRGAQATQFALDDSLSELRGPFWDAATTTAETLRDASRLIVLAEGLKTSGAWEIRLHLADEDIYFEPFDVVDGFAAFSEQDLLVPEIPQRTGVLQVNSIYVPLALGVSRNLTLIANIFTGSSQQRDCGGAHVLGWHEMGFGATKQHTVSPMQVLQGMLNGYLGADTIAPIAAELRLMKHNDPLFGIIAAYLYDRAGDIASIRRICYFYWCYGQAVPFDIALLARLPLYHIAEGGFMIDVPAVQEDPIGKANELPEYAWQATETGVGLHVSGVVPLLRMGWSRLATLAPDDSSLREFIGLGDGMTEAPFASFSEKDAGRNLIQMIRTIYRDG